MELVTLPQSLCRDDLVRRLPGANRHFHDRTGEKHERCEVIGLAGFFGRKAVWLCRCDCGNQYLLRATDLNPSSVPRGCGCRRGEMHGLHKSYIYQAWCNMMQRCYNPNDPKFHRYGKRGIKVCELWQRSPSAFAAHAGPRPSRKYSIDRINNNGNYEPGNIRWATRKQQMANRECSLKKAS